MPTAPTIVYNPYYVGGAQPRQSKNLWTWAQVRTVPYAVSSGQQPGGVTNFGTGSHSTDYNVPAVEAKDADDDIYRGVPRGCIGGNSFNDGTDEFFWWGAYVEDVLNPGTYYPVVDSGIDNDDASEILTGAVIVGSTNSVTADDSSWDDSTAYGQAYAPVGTPPVNNQIGTVSSLTLG